MRAFLAVKGLVVEVRTDPSSLLGCVRRGVRAFCDSGRDGVPCEVGPRALPVGKAMRRQGRFRTLSVCGPGPWPTDFPSTLALRFTSPR